MSIRHKRGQSTLEYVLLVTAVLVVLIGLVVGPKSFFSQQVNSTFVSGLTKMNNMGAKLLVEK